MSKTQLSNKTSSVDLKQILERDIRLGTEHDNLSKSTIAIYLHQLTKLYIYTENPYQWSPEEFLKAIRYPQRYDDAEFQKVFIKSRILT
ncbi:unnamed protein product [Phytophthora fragariaefolia]|uniref:Unnamed protein product n=1 Tax=Phytophthora fragariaefolia TaxID=1490495 RepID=A0A9W6YG29_9STRA|nr:unnamed protein product [Phytophthora fragariaefolia]